MGVVGVRVVFNFAGLVGPPVILHGSEGAVGLTSDAIEVCF